MRASLRLLSAFVLLAAGLRAAAAPSEVDAVITRARSRLGSEQALATVTSVHFEGTYETSGDPAEAQKGTIEMIFQKPFQHRSVITSSTGREEVTGLDGLESWMRVKEGKDQRLTLYPKEQTKTLRANTWQTLEFYRGVERIGGTVELMGEETVDGVLCSKVIFRHDASLAWTRYFDKATGRLVLTETAQGKTREEGEIVTDGVRFPKKLTSVVKNAAGKEVTVTIVFSKVTVNEKFPANLFTVPTIASLRQQP
jgi:outer membrane lipoprotein-sorting protein